MTNAEREAMKKHVLANIPKADQRTHLHGGQEELEKQSGTKPSFSKAILVLSSGPYQELIPKV